MYVAKQNKYLAVLVSHTKRPNRPTKYHAFLHPRLEISVQFRIPYDVGPCVIYLSSVPFVVTTANQILVHITHDNTQKSRARK